MPAAPTKRGDAPIRRYAEDTEVPIERRRQNIEALLERYRASEFGYHRSEQQVTIGFRMNGRRYAIPMKTPPRPNIEDFRRNPAGGYIRSGREQQTAYDQAFKNWEQDQRRRWAQLEMLLKAMLDSIADDGFSAESILLAFAILPDGSGTVGEWAEQYLGAAYEAGIEPPPIPIPPIRGPLLLGPARDRS